MTYTRVPILLRRMGQDHRRRHRRFIVSHKNESLTDNII